MIEQDYIQSFDINGLVGIQIMTAKGILSSMGFRCTDVSRQATYTSLNPAGTFSCTATKQLGLGVKYIDIVLPFSEKGIVMDAIKNERTANP